MPYKLQGTCVSYTEKVVERTNLTSNLDIARSCPKMANSPTINLLIKVLA